MVKDQCFSAEPNTRECALLLQKLDYTDILSVIMAKVHYWFLFHIILYADHLIRILYADLLIRMA